MKRVDCLEALRDLEQEFEAEARALDPYDTLTWAGYPPWAHTAWPDAASVSRALSGSPIRRALLSHTAGWLHDPGAGNRALAALLNELPGFFGVMTLAPASTYGAPDIGNYIDSCVRDGMRAARLLPQAHRYTLRTPGVDTLLEALTARRIPLFIPIGHTSWNEIGPVARSHPGLKLLVESAGHHEYLNLRAALPWLEQCPNILVPTNRQFMAGGVELLADRLGAHRLLFASGRPLEDPWASLGPLVMSRLPDEQRRLIAHGNLESLLDAAGQEENTP